MAVTGSKGKTGRVKGIPERLVELGKIGLGTMVHPKTECRIARLILFDMMKKTPGHDLRNLRNSSLPLYKTLFDLGRSMLPHESGNVPVLVIRELISHNRESSRRHCVQDWSSLSEAADHFSEAKELAAEISRWSGALNMTTDWFCDAVLNNILGWHLSPADAEALSWGYQGIWMELQDSNRTLGDLRREHGWRTLDSRLPVPVVKPYNPSTQTRAEHQAVFLLALDRYYAQQEELFAQAGFQKTILKRSRAGKSSMHHFAWFIKYQMKKWSASRIAEAEGRNNAVGQEAIYEAVRKLAKVLQVPLRKEVGISARQFSKKTLNS